jgi:hypothetical protein
VKAKHIFTFCTALAAKPEVAIALFLAVVERANINQADFNIQ